MNVNEAKILEDYSLLTTLAFSDDGYSSKLCALCADFQIRAVPEFDPEALITTMVSQHEIRQQYEDIFPAFPYMEKRAIDGCTFCNFLRTSLISESRGHSLHRRVRCKKNSVPENQQRSSGRTRGGLRGVGAQIILTATINEHVDHKSALSMYRSEEPNSIRVMLHIADGEWIYPGKAYKITFQMSSGT
jgi:hypothetical protein